MAMKKSTPKPARPGGNPGGVVRQVISPSVSVLGKQIITGMPGSVRKSLTPAQLKEAQALADRIKALEIKVANEKKANAKIIKEQNKQKPLTTGRGATKPITTTSESKPKPPVVKVTPRGGRGGGGGLLGGRGGLSVNR